MENVTVHHAPPTTYHTPNGQPQVLGTIASPVSPRTGLPFRWARGRCEIPLYSAGKGGSRACSSTGSRLCVNPACRIIACGLHGAERCRCGSAFVAVLPSAIELIECEGCTAAIAARVSDVSRIESGAPVEVSYELLDAGARTCAGCESHYCSTCASVHPSERACRAEILAMRAAWRGMAEVA